MPTRAPIDTPAEERSARQAAVLEAIGDGVLVLPSAPLRLASRDTEHPYVPDRDLFYLTGLVEPGALAVLVGGDEPRLELFVRPRDEAAELWTGPRLDADEAAAVSGARTVHTVDELSERLPGLLGGRDRIWYRQGSDRSIDHHVAGALETGRARGQRTGLGPRGVLDPGLVLDELRLVKSAHELTRLREACRITCAGHLAAAGAIREGVGEWVVEAELERAFRAGGAARPGFESIVGGGARSCVLHYVANDQPIPPGGLVLVDAGAEHGLYHGDVTRTWPASGRFTTEQREVYELVNLARLRAIDVVRPGATIADVHEAAVVTLTEGLTALGVLQGDPEELLAEGAYRAFFPHQTSHWLGLDVHDPGDYARSGEPRVLEPGMVFTIEPGLYFRPGLTDDRAAAFAGIGVRIEDDVAVTGEGREVLTSDVPTGPAEVEALVRG